MNGQSGAGGEARVRYGVVGSGMMGVEHIHNLAAMAARPDLTGGVAVQLVALADPHPPSQAAGLAAAARAGWTDVQVFPDVYSLLASGECECDVLVVATPNMTHAALLTAILRHPRRVHMLVEKPLATSVQGCDLVLALTAARAPAAAGVVQVGLEYRFMPPVAALLHEVRGGAVGRVHMVAIREHRFPFLHKVGAWNRFNGNSGGTLVEKCCHFFDLMNLILNDTPTRVMASGAQSVNHLSEEYNGKVGGKVGGNVGSKVAARWAASDRIVTFTSWTHPPDLDSDFSPEGFWYSHTIPEAERTRAQTTIQHSAAAETTSTAAETTSAAAKTTLAAAETAAAAAATSPPISVQTSPQASTPTPTCIVAHPDIALAKTSGTHEWDIQATRC
ncbi:unnamed protein product [Closterium sp. NIES-54]